MVSGQSCLTPLKCIHSSWRIDPFQIAFLDRHYSIYRCVRVFLKAQPHETSYDFRGEAPSIRETRNLRFSSQFAKGIIGNIVEPRADKKEKGAQEVTTKQEDHPSFQRLAECLTFYPKLADQRRP